MDKNEQQRKTLRITAKTVNGTTGTSEKPFLNVIRWKQEWRFETWKSANKSRGDRDGAGYRYSRNHQVQSVFVWPPPEKQQVKQWVYQA